jgi:hypothetical protein
VLAGNTLIVNQRKESSEESVKSALNGPLIASWFEAHFGARCVGVNFRDLSTLCHLHCAADVVAVVKA